MGWMYIRDDAIWLKHVHDEPGLVAHLAELPDDAPVDLLVDGNRARFRKMRRGRDGRPTLGLKPDPASLPFWRNMQSRRGERVVITRADERGDETYLSSLTSLLDEWNSPEDCAAYDKL